MKNPIYRAALFSTFLSLILAAGATAQIRTTRTNWQTRSLVTRIETKTDQFKNTIQNSLNRSPINNTNREDRIMDFISDFEGSTDSLRSNLESGQNIRVDVAEVLNRALFIDRFMMRNRISIQARNQWSSIRTDLNSLAAQSRVAWNWNRIPEYSAENNYPTGNFPDRTTSGGFGTGRGFDSRLTGTYRLNRGQSDDVAAVIGRYDTTYETEQRDRVRTNLERRLTPPDMLAIQKTGNTVILGSSLSPQITFEADGVARSETTRNGRTIRTTASTSSDGLLVSYEGDRSNDFYITFSPTREGQLRVTRKLYLENRNETVSVTSVYDKTNNVAQWSDMNAGGTVAGNTGDGSTRDFYVRNGERLTAVLRNAVSTQASQTGDRFTMEVTSPATYRGAVIEGRLGTAEQSGRVSGRASLNLEFDTIRMPDGNTYRFGGNIDSVRAANGDNVRVNNEGTVRDSNQTTRTATRAGIGAALGALIGAIAGGGSGAAIGAAVGAGAGAGTVFIQGRDNIELAQGTEFTITASSPNNVGGRNY